jgi:hypothetical protein
MNFLKLSTMEYSKYEGDIRLEYPEIRDDQTGDTFPVPDDYVQVEQTVPPIYDNKTQYLSQAAPIQVDGVWQSVWVVNEDTAEQLATLAALVEATKPPKRKQRPPVTNSGSAPNVIT